MGEVDYIALGDSAILIQFDDRGHEDVHQTIVSLMDALEANPFPGYIECVPGFYSVAVYYEPSEVFDEKNFHRLPYDIVLQKIKHMIHRDVKKIEHKQRTVVIPVCYGGEYGPDLEFVAKYHRLGVDEVVEMHVNTKYFTRMIGFAPGFPYLQGLNARLSTPRRDSPRLTIPAGSVGIGGNQTGIYPLESPGGWQIIGRSPIRLFSADQEPPSLLQAGDLVQFKPITSAEYIRLKESGA